MLYSHSWNARMHKTRDADIDSQSGHQVRHEIEKFSHLIINLAPQSIELILCIFSPKILLPLSICNNDYERAICPFHTRLCVKRGYESFMVVMKKLLALRRIKFTHFGGKIFARKCNLGASKHMIGIVDQRSNLINFWPKI